MSVFCLKSPDCVFVGIPKTASSTVREGLWQKRYQAHYGVGMPAFAARLIAEGQPSFTFIRHPLDRLASAFRDFTQIRGMICTPNDFVDVVLNKHISYELFMPDNKIRHHTLPLTHPAYALDYAQHIFRFERINHHLPYWCKKLGLDYGDRLPHVKPTTGNGYVDFMKRLTADRRERILQY